MGMSQKGLSLKEQHLRVSCLWRSLRSGKKPRAKSLAGGVRDKDHGESLGGIRGFDPRVRTEL